MAGKFERIYRVIIEDECTFTSVEGYKALTEVLEAFSINYSVVEDGMEFIEELKFSGTTLPGTMK